MTPKIYRYSFLGFILFTLLAGVAFWPNYFSRLGTLFPSEIHMHAITMSSWCLLLILQGTLIRTGKFSWHRWTGNLSFLLVPLILYSGLQLTRMTLSGSRAPVEILHTNAALMINSLIVFAILFGLAIFFRKNPGIHARYMIATVFPILTPVTDRLIYFHLPWLVPYAPKLSGMPMVPVFGFLLADILVLILMLADGFKRRQHPVFAVVLALLAFYHFTYLHFFQYPFWQKFSGWLLGIPS